LRTEPIGSTKLIKLFSDRFNLAKLVASEGTQQKLQQAGMRGPYAADGVQLLPLRDAVRAVRLWPGLFLRDRQLPLDGDDETRWRRWWRR
jgi:hypothetical protein